MLHAGRPDLLASEIAEILRQTGAVEQAAAGCRRLGDLAAPADSSPDPTAERLTTSVVCLPVGSTDGNFFEVNVNLKPDVESVATINAVTLLGTHPRPRMRARRARGTRSRSGRSTTSRSTNGQAVVAGQMRELMAFARRIATTNVSVLITGESGTGKEILARAIHAFSHARRNRSSPFNCTAMPRGLLESQLFGHRRGSFTGADRDNPGLIRTARDGTLFLDEIGELGLDLQPKLLRFLEVGRNLARSASPTPFTVDVRVVAATNANLERLVREGRFREDLFYRLNVIRLPIPPAARAARRDPRARQLFRRARRTGVRQGPDPPRRRNDGVPAALSLARQRAAAEQRAAPHDRARRAELDHRPGRYRRRIRAILPISLERGRPYIAVPLHDKPEPTL